MLEGVQNGIVEIGGFCFCFAASKIPRYAFQNEGRIIFPLAAMETAPVQRWGQD